MNKSTTMSSRRNLNKPRTISIFTAFSLFLVLVVSLLGLFTTLYFNRSIHSLMKTSQDQELHHDAQYIKEQVDNFIDIRTMILQDYAAFHILDQVVMQPEMNLKNGAELIRSFSLLGLKPQFLVLDFEGSLLISSDDTLLFDYTLDDSIIDILNGNKANTTSINVRDNEFYLRIGVPIKYIDNVEGVLIAEISFSEILDLFRNPEQRKRRYFQFVVDDQTIATLGQPTDSEPMVIPFDHMGLTILYQNDQSQFILEERKILQGSLPIHVLITLGALIVAMLLIRKLFVNPLHQLELASESMATAKQISAISTDYKIGEFKSLAVYFNKMIKTVHEHTWALKQANDEMEGKVKERTKELKQMNEQLNRKILERKELTDSLVEHKERLELATSSAGIGVWDWNIESNILKWDERMYQVYGIDKSHFSNAYEAWQKTLHPEDKVKAEHDLELAIQGKVDFDTDFRVIWQDQSIHNIKAYGIVQRNDAGKAVRVIGVNWDITEKKEIENSLKQYALEIEEKNKDLEDFAHVASHDLKSPLLAIVTLSQWIEEDLEDHFTEESRKNMNLLRGRVERMECLIDDLLEYSRVGRKEYKSEIVDVKELVKEVLELIDLPSGFKIKISGELPTFQTVKLPLKEVFINLIWNAIKHHHQPSSGEVTISVKTMEEFYQFRIRDNGPGIPPELHSKALQMFQTLQGRDELEGSGIGLALVEKIVKNYGGSLELVSEEEVGLSVIFKWPKTPMEV